MAARAYDIVSGALLCSYCVRTGSAVFPLVPVAIVVVVAAVVIIAAAGVVAGVVHTKYDDGDGCAAGKDPCLAVVAAPCFVVVDDMVPALNPATRCANSFAA